MLLAGLRAEGYTEIVEPVLSRDHTERMLNAFGVELIQMEGKEGHVIKLKGGQRLVATEVFCPADPSSASFFVALAVLLEGLRGCFYQKQGTHKGTKHRREE